MRTLLAPIFLLLCSGLAAIDAMAAPKVAIVSLVGDRLMVASYRLQTGSHVDQNVRQSVVLESDELDVATARILEQAVRNAAPQAATLPLKLTNRSLHQLADRVADGQAAKASVIEALRPALQSQNATHLLLVTRHRGETQVRMREGTVGSGRIEGLGFYLDRSRRYEQRDTGLESLGLIAPFAYVKITLVKADTMEVLREETATATSSLTPGRGPGAIDPWEVLTPEQKVEALKSLLTEESRRIVPKLLEKM